MNQLIYHNRILEALNNVERANLCEILKRHVYAEKTQLIKRGEKGKLFFFHQFKIIKYWISV